jgi:hypothetical protein
MEDVRGKDQERMRQGLRQDEEGSGEDEARIKGTVA